MFTNKNKAPGGSSVANSHLKLCNLMWRGAELINVIRCAILFGVSWKHIIEPWLGLADRKAQLALIKADIVRMPIVWMDVCSVIDAGHFDEMKPTVSDRARVHTHVLFPFGPA